MRNLFATMFILTLTRIAITGCKSFNDAGTSRLIELKNGGAVELIQTPQGFWIGKTEVTQTQWESVMGNNPSKFRGGDLPVDNVSWNDCQMFLEKLNALPSVRDTGLTFRLPSDTEWEYACRSGATGDYCCLADGTETTREKLDGVAWFDANSAEQTHAVGQKAPNAFGLHDMHGNVWEWTATEESGDRVLRGGSWKNSVDSCKSSNRGRYSPFFAYQTLGFRLCASGRAD